MYFSKQKLREKKYPYFSCRNFGGRGILFLSVFRKVKNSLAKNEEFLVILGKSPIGSIEVAQKKSDNILKKKLFKQPKGLVACEDLAGITSHAIDIFRK